MDETLNTKSEENNGVGGRGIVYRESRDTTNDFDAAASTMGAMFDGGRKKGDWDEEC